MATFTDKLGRRWAVALTLGDFRRVREGANVNLNDVLTSGETVAALLYGDPETLGRALWVLCESQAEKAGVSPEGFADGFDADTLDRAAVALSEALVDFFHRRQSAVVKSRLPNLMATADEVVAAEYARLLSPPGGGSPGSSASTPAP